ncbi:tetratricopeptide repeat protein [Streptomyces sp. NPDC001153]
MEIRGRLATNAPDAYEPDLASALNNLASAYATAGDLDRAIPLYERTLDDSVRVLDEDHPETLYARNNLASASASARAGDADRAIPLYERTLDDSVRVLGEDHPNTLYTRNNLALARGEAGTLLAPSRPTPSYWTTWSKSWDRNTPTPAPHVTTWPIGGGRRGAPLFTPSGLSTDQRDRPGLVTRPLTARRPWVQRD